MRTARGVAVVLARVFAVLVLAAGFVVWVGVWSMSFWAAL